MNNENSNNENSASERVSDDAAKSLQNILNSVRTSVENEFAIQQMEYDELYGVNSEEYQTYLKKVGDWLRANKLIDMVMDLLPMSLAMDISMSQEPVQVDPAISPVLPQPTAPTSPDSTNPKLPAAQIPVQTTITGQRKLPTGNETFSPDDAVDPTETSDRLPPVTNDSLEAMKETIEGSAPGNEAPQPATPTTDQLLAPLKEEGQPAPLDQQNQPQEQNQVETPPPAAQIQPPPPPPLPIQPPAPPAQPVPGEQAQPALESPQATNPQLDSIFPPVQPGQPTAEQSPVQPDQPVAPEVAVEDNQASSHELAVKNSAYTPSNAWSSNDPNFSEPSMPMPPPPPPKNVDVLPTDSGTDTEQVLESIPNDEFAPIEAESNPDIPANPPSMPPAPPKMPPPPPPKTPAPPAPEPVQSVANNGSDDTESSGFSSGTWASADQDAGWAQVKAQQQQPADAENAWGPPPDLPQIGSSEPATAPEPSQAPEPMPVPVQAQPPGPAPEPPQNFPQPPAQAQPPVPAPEPPQNFPQPPAQAQPPVPAPEPPQNFPQPPSPPPMAPQNQDSPPDSPWGPPPEIQQAELRSPPPNQQIQPNTNAPKKDEKEDDSFVFDPSTAWG